MESSPFSPTLCGSEKGWKVVIQKRNQMFLMTEAETIGGYRSDLIRLSLKTLRGLSLLISLKRPR